jgi:hypothetical protein
LREPQPGMPLPCARDVVVSGVWAKSRDLEKPREAVLCDSAGPGVSRAVCLGFLKWCV